MSKSHAYGYLKDRYLANEPVATIASVVFANEKDKRIPFSAYAQLANATTGEHNARDLADAISNLFRFVQDLEREGPDAVKLQVKSEVVLREKALKDKSIDDQYKLVYDFIMYDMFDLYGWFLLLQSKILPMTYSDLPTARALGNQEPLANRIVKDGKIEKFIQSLGDSSAAEHLQFISDEFKNSHKILGPRLMLLERDPEGGKKKSVVNFYKVLLTIARRLSDEEENHPLPCIAFAFPLWKDDEGWKVCGQKHMKITLGSIETLSRIRVVDDPLGHLIKFYEGLSMPPVHVSLLQPNYYVIHLSSYHLATSLRERYHYMAESLSVIKQNFENKTIREYISKLRDVGDEDSANDFVAYVKQIYNGEDFTEAMFYGRIPGPIPDTNVDVSPMFTLKQMSLIETAVVRDRER